MLAAALIAVHEHITVFSRKLRCLGVAVGVAHLETEINEGNGNVSLGRHDHLFVVIGYILKINLLKNQF